MSPPARQPVPRRRTLHPLAWWAWSASLAVCAMEGITPNPFLLLLIVAVVVFVAISCRNSAPWSRSIGFFLALAVLAVVIRIVIEIVFGRRGLPGHVLFALPRVPLPHWAAGVSIGGAVTLESVLTSAVLGLQIAVILVCFGAANTLLASPYRLLRCPPAVLYETGVAVTVALSFTPELIQSILLVRQARRLRGHPTAGLRGIRGVAVPVLESALDRSLQLATSMDSRGYGRRSDLTTRSATPGLRRHRRRPAGHRRPASTASPPPDHSGGLGLPIIAAGSVSCGVGLAVGGRRTTRSRYRPDPWRTPEWLVALSGLAALATFSIAHALDLNGLVVTFPPLWPSRPSRSSRWSASSPSFDPRAFVNPTPSAANGPTYPGRRRRPRPRPRHRTPKPTHPGRRERLKP